MDAYINNLNTIVEGVILVVLVVLHTVVVSVVSAVSNQQRLDPPTAGKDDATIAFHALHVINAFSGLSVDIDITNNVGHKRHTHHPFLLSGDLALIVLLIINILLQKVFIYILNVIITTITTVMMTLMINLSTSLY